MYEYNLVLRFDRIVRSQPGKAAIVFPPERSISYGELAALSSRICAHFIQQGLGAGDVLAIGGRKTPETYAAAIAALRIGAAYVFLDPMSPVDRLSRILDTCRPRILFAQEALLAALARDGLTCVPSEGPPLAARLDATKDVQIPESRSVTGSTPAYIMYTSGSTGNPKGAVITHAGVLNLVDWAAETYEIQPEDRSTGLNPLYFDNAVFDLYSSLWNGTTLVAFEREHLTDGAALPSLVDAMGCTIWFSVPSLLIYLQTIKVLKPDNLRTIRAFIFGGEGYPKPKLHQLFDLYGGRARLHNVYGPTECTCICSSHLIGPEDFADESGLPTLGRLAPNFGGLVLDEDDRPVPPGEIGELCLLGPNVGLGYYNDPEQSAAHFVQNPRNTRFHEAMYRTGDLVRIDARSGCLDIVGRKDNQIKHMGYRIELEEIETALNRLEEVNEAVALQVRPRGISQIIAVVAVDSPVDEAELREKLRQYLPEYMVPGRFYQESVLPKNQNGKVDRKELRRRHEPK